MLEYTGFEINLNFFTRNQPHLYEGGKKKEKIKVPVKFAHQFSLTR